MVLISFMLVLFEITKQNDFSLRNKAPPPFVSQRVKKLWDFHDLTEIHSFNRKLVSHFLFIFFSVDDMWAEQNGRTGKRKSISTWGEIN